MRIELLGKKFYYYVSIERYDKDNDYYESDPSITFHHDDPTFIRDHAVSLDIRYRWTGKEWSVYDQTTYWDWDGRDGKFRPIASKQFMKPYFKAFLKQWPEWEIELLPRALHIEIEKFKSDIEYKKQRLAETEATFAKLDITKPLEDVLWDFRVYAHNHFKKGY